MNFCIVLDMDANDCTVMYNDTVDSTNHSDNKLPANRSSYCSKFILMISQPNIHRDSHNTGLSLSKAFLTKSST